MSYDSRKVLVGQEYVEEIEMVLDACKYAYGDYPLHNLMVYSGVTRGAGYVGALNISTTLSDALWLTTWGSTGTQYAKLANGEILSFTVTSISSITITARALFGTTAVSINSLASLRILHKGEADGSCRGFPFTCSNTDSYSATSKISLIYSTGNNAGGVRRFPGLHHKDVSHDAGEVDPGESIGARAQLKFSIKNQIHNDYGIVPYPDKQTSTGTMFGKLLARHPYFQGREVIYREGYRDANTYQAPDFIERRFIMDAANLTNGMFSVTALDPIILTEDKKSQMPIASPAVLSAAITGTPISFSYVNAPSFYFGALSSPVYVRIDSEVIRCTVSGATQLTVVQRGYRSISKDHDAGASIQDCILFEGTHGINAITFSLQNYTKIPAKYIGSYASVIASLPAFVLHKSLITKPMAVADFINSMVQLGNLIFRYDEETQKIAIEYTPELQIQPISVDQQVDIKRDSVSIDNNVKNQFTRLAYLFAPVDITKDTEENYAIRFLSANVALESAEYLGQINERKMVKNYLLDNSTGDSLLATSYVGRVLQNNSAIPKIANLTLDASKVGQLPYGKLTVGSIVNLSTKYSEDKDGNPISELYQVLKLVGNGYDGFKAKMRRYQALIPEVVDFTVTTGGANFNLSSVYAPASPGLYVVYVNPGVEFFSYNAANPAFTTGTQVAGVSFKLILRGKVLGMGGAGGDSGLNSINPTAGVSGGTALNATVPMSIDASAGLIWAGGGGGAGEYCIGGSGYFPAARGGTGGQGYGISAGGRYTNGSVPPTSPTFDGTEASGNASGPGVGVKPGGEWGEEGSSTPANTLLALPVVAGGASGIAVKSNGNSVTIISGDNTLNIRGRRE